MAEKKTFRSGLILLELLAAITIFALAGAVCIRVLVKADALTLEARAMEQGVSAVSSAAEILRSASSEEEALALLENPEFPGNGELTLAVHHEGGCTVFDLGWVSGGEEVYSLELKRYFREVTP